LLEEFPETQLNILIVWIKMYEIDSFDVVGEAARLFKDDPRVAQFYDPEKISGLEVAEGFGAEPGEVAWDIYLFYDSQAEWLENLPQPKDWLHQLRGSSWADPERLVQGDQLASRLREIMSDLLQNEVDT
jgi:hypothetical protein